MFSSAAEFISSNLPIIDIRVTSSPYGGRPVEIPDNPRVIGQMKIIKRPEGQRNFLTDKDSMQYLDYSGFITIEVRGSSSQTLPKKPYALTTVKSDFVSNNNVSLLGLPKENDWILNALAFDPSLIRDFLIYNITNQTGNYAPRGHFCELVINGDYKGLYILLEKIKIDENRVNLLKMTNLDNSEPEISGGYMIKSDKSTDNDQIAWFMNGAPFIYDTPKPLLITAKQKSYIYKQFTSFQETMNSQNSNVTNGFPSFIDIPSFVDFMLINEIASNVDAYHLSTYFHKDRNGKIKAGPVWDFNLTFGNDLFAWGLDRSHTNVWMFDNVDLNGAKFWKDLYSNSTFKCYMAKRWKELTESNQPLNYDKICLQMDEYVSLLSESAKRENERWGTVGNQVDNVEEIKVWLKERMKWLDAKFVNLRCSYPTTPSLVISGINYHPMNVDGFSEDSLEFIRISNNSNEIVHLTGYYFRENGLTYQFPVNSTINPQSEIYLSSNRNAFEKFYGFSPFGEYTRTLSNKSFHLELADGYGNLIDEVEYFDESPWPIHADGNGSYLTLLNLNFDNNIPDSWSDSHAPLKINEVESDPEITYHYDQFTNRITIDNSLNQIIKIELYNLTGSKLTELNALNQDELRIDLHRYGMHIYIIKITLKSGNIQTNKILTSISPK